MALNVKYILVALSLSLSPAIFAADNFDLKALQFSLEEDYEELKQYVPEKNKMEAATLIDSVGNIHQLLSSFLLGGVFTNGGEWCAEEKPTVDNLSEIKQLIPDFKNDGKRNADSIIMNCGNKEEVERICKSILDNLDKSLSQIKLLEY